jgi:predicted nucleic acid-binding protein
LLAALAPDQRRHRECARVLLERPGPFVLSPFVVAELDYLLTKLAGPPAALRLLDEVGRGAYLLAPFAAADIARARAILERHARLDLGLADASLVVLSERYATVDLLSLDERHFRTLRGAGGRRFRLLPFER